jgi:hypothetical protein
LLELRDGVGTIGACQHEGVSTGAAPYVFRPWTGRLVTIGLAVIAVVAVLGIAWQYGVADGLRAAPWLALVVGACWALLWRPHVEVDDAGVRLVNVFRTVVLPWPAITAIDTKWALTLVTAYGKYTAWAAPAPGAAGTMRAHRSETKGLPSSTYGPEGIRPGDLPSSASGETALLIRERWEQLRDAGYLDDPRLEQPEPPVTLHVGVLLGGLGLLVLALLTLVV